MFWRKKKPLPESKQIITPSTYFDLVKSRKHEMNDEELNRIYDNCLVLLNKYVVTGQTKGAQKLIFHLDCIERERQIVKEGIHTFVYQEDIEDYIDNIEKDTVKIIELKDYERELPDSVVSTLEKVGTLFDKLYVVFTDYTGKIERKVATERRERDPILFGTLQQRETSNMLERFYFIADWEDEFCHLTLEKMSIEMQELRNKNIALPISTPKDINELKEQLSSIRNRNGVFVHTGVFVPSDSDES